MLNYVNSNFINSKILKKGRNEVDELYRVYVTLRDGKGVRDYEIAKATGINPVAFSEWKKGKSVPKFDRLVKIADYFGVSTEEFAKALRG